MSFILKQPLPAFLYCLTITPTAQTFIKNLQIFVKKKWQGLFVQTSVQIMAYLYRVSVQIKAYLYRVSVQIKA